MMPGKTYRAWSHTREWCKANPTKVAAIVTREGTFTIKFEPTPPPKEVVIEFIEP